MSSARIEITRRLLMSIGRSDPSDAIPLLAPAVTFSVLGHHPLAGTYSGPQQVAEHLTDLFEATLGTFDTIKWEDWLEGDTHTAVVADVHLQVGGARLSSRQIFIIEFDHLNLIKAVCIFSDKPDALDRLLAHPPT